MLRSPDRTAGMPTFELLEPRLLLAASLSITEFMADNESTLQDEDGDYSDWIEIYNAGPDAANLSGYFLTDEADDLDKWAFPSVTLGSGQYMVVFASGKNRRVPGSPLHTNFQLNKDGEYLALVMPDRKTIVWEYADEYPRQFADISYGIGQNIETTTLVGEEAPAAALIPTSGTLGLTWTLPGFDDSGWTLRGTTGVGFMTTVPGFAVYNYKANVYVDSLSVAEDVIKYPYKQAWVASENASVINYFNTGGEGHYGNNRAFPGTTIGVDVEDFVTLALATITIPTTGAYTFGVSSDDGFGLTITNGVDTFSMSYPAPRAPADTLATFNFTTAGQYSLRLVSYERGGGSETELFAARGTFTSFNPTDFDLVGDTANGGLAVQAQPVGQGSLNYDPLIGLDLESAMYGVNGTAYIRIPFTVADPSALSSLTLRMKYDDGFVAYLNGHEIARQNAPSTPKYNSVATAEHPTGQTLEYEDIDVTSALAYLQAGNNVLAVHGLNRAAGNGDFLILPQLCQIRLLGLGEHYFSTPSPGQPNSTSYYAFVEDTKFDHDRGFYDAPFDLTITTATPGATIRYTTDGSAPTATTGTVYTGPIHISTTTVIRAAAFKAGYEPTDVDTQTYVFPAAVLQQPANPPGFPSTWGYDGGNPVMADYEMDPAIVNDPAYASTMIDDLKSLPVVSLVMNVNDLFGPSGIYSNPWYEGVDWERACSIEFFDAAGGRDFQVNAGARIYGGVGRSPSVKRHSFRILFKGDYGPTKLEFPLFDDTNVDEFESIILRANFNDAWNPMSWGSRSQYLRDHWARETQLALGQVSAHGRPVHLYINGLYWGLYELTERPDAAFAASYFGGQREDYDALNAGEVIQGDRTAWDEMIRLANTGHVEPGYPYDPNALASAAAYQAIQQYINPTHLADYVLFNYYTGNWDWDGHNWYAARPRVPGGQFEIFAWDTEWIMGGLYENVTGTNNDDRPTRVFNQLRANEEFRMLVADRAYRMYFNDGALTPAKAAERYQALADEIYRAIVCESARWGDLIVEPPFTRDGAWLPEKNWLITQYFPARTAIALQQLRDMGLYPSFDPPAFNQHGGTINPGFVLTMTNPGGAGTIYYTTDGTDPRLPGGGISPTALIYSGPITLSDSTQIKARIKSGSTWSAVHDATFVLATPPAIRITELMYHPADPVPPGSYTDEDFEFIEVKNVGTATINLAGMRFADGVDFVFPDVDLAPGQYALVVRNQAAFESRYGTGLNVVGQYVGSLNNAGERIRLEGRFGEEILDFSYSPAWLPETDGGGFSLTIIDPLADRSTWGDRDSWRLSTYVGGSPGADNPGLPLGSIVINEVLTHTDADPPGDWIELRNTTGAPIDIGGWYLSDEAANLMKYRIAPGTILPAGAYISFTQAANFSNPADPGCLVPFQLSELGEEVRLTAVDGSGNLIGYREVQSFGPADREVSFGRYVTSTGNVEFVAMSSPTRGYANAYPKVGPVVINEIHYHPADGDDEFLELRNVTGSPVALYDPAHPENCWRLEGGINYTIPAGTSIPADGYLLIVNIDPEAFRAKYGIAPGVQILGPYSGNLANEGESIRLCKPGDPEPGGMVPYILVDRVKYDDASPWPIEPDGGGPSLQRTVATNYGNDPANWNAGPDEGTPGVVNGSTDVTPPRLVSAATEDGVPNKVIVTFNEAVDPVTARQPGNYTIAGAQVTGVSAGINDHTVNLVTTTLLEGTVYTLSVSNVLNAAGIPIAPGSQALFTYVEAGTGLRAEYYDNADFTNLKLVRTDPTVDFYWQGGSPDPVIGADTFSVRWTGRVKPAYTETYTFYTISDDGVRLWVNGQLIINNWTDHGDTEDAGSIALVAGQKYDIRMEMYENGGWATARLLWSSAHQPKAVISSAYLYPGYLPPVSADDAYVAAANSTLNVPAAGVLANDVDPEHLPLSAVLVSNVSHGDLTLRPDGSFTYVPQPGYFGPDAFTYKATNGYAEGNIATVTLTVNCAPQVTGVTLNGRPGRTVSAIEPSGIGVRTIDVAFSEPVFFTASDVILQTVTFEGNVETVTGTLTPLSLTGSGTAAMSIAFANASVVDTWVKVTLRGDGTLVDDMGHRLDGEAKPGGSGRGYIYSASLDLPSGNGVAGGNAVFYVGNLRGDFRGVGFGIRPPDGRITSGDIDGFTAKYQAGDLDADFRGVGFGVRPPDGLITSGDIDGFTAVYQAAVAQNRHLDPLPTSLPQGDGDPEPLAAEGPEPLAATAQTTALPESQQPASADFDVLAFAGLLGDEEAVLPAAEPVPGAATHPVGDIPSVVVSDVVADLAESEEPVLGDLAAPSSDGGDDDASAAIEPDGGLADLLAVPAIELPLAC